MDTYAHIELDCSPENKHGAVAVTILDAVDLQVAHDGADGREKTKSENADETDFFAPLDVKTQQDGKGDDPHDDIADNSNDGIGRETWAGSQALPCLWGSISIEWVPRFIDL